MPMGVTWNDVPPTIRQDVMPPALQLVCAPDGGEHILAGLQAKVIGVVEAETAAGLLQLLGSQALKRGLRSHGHEHGQLHRAVGQR